MSAPSTVVFTDLIGSTVAFDSLDNAKSSQVLTHLTRWIREIFEARGGRVVKTLGGGVLAAFEHTQDAIEAVVEMQRAHQRRLSERPKEEQLALRAGIATGAVENLDGDCYGDAVILASRFCELAGPHEIWCNDAVPASAGQSKGVMFRHLGSISIRGRAEPCSAFHIDWKEEASSTLMTQQPGMETLIHAKMSDVSRVKIELTWQDQTATFSILELPVQIGRTRQCEFVVNDPRVSRVHARIVWRNGNIFIVDVSSNGTWVNFVGGGAEVQLRRDECVIQGSGEMSLGLAFTHENAPMLRFRVCG